MRQLTDDADFVRLLYELGESVHLSEDPKEVMASSLKKIVGYYKAPFASISMYNPDSNRLDIEVCHGLPEDCQDYRLPMGVGVTGWVALHNQAALVDDVKNDPRYVEIVPSICSALAVPLVNGSQSFGVISIESEQVSAFSDLDLEKLEAISGVLVRVQNRIWRIAGLKKKTNQMESINKMVGQLSNRFELKGVLSDLTKEARKILDCRMSSLFLLNSDKRLELEVLIGVEGVIDHQESLSLDETSMGTAVHHGKTIEVTHLIATEENHFPEIILSENLESMLITPIVYEKEVIGVLNVYTSVRHRFSDTEKQIFRALADMGAFAIENSKLYSRIIDSEDTLRNSERLTTLGLLSAEIAHEIRNPLTVIKLLVESLSLNQSLDSDSQKDLEVVLEKIKNLGEIVGRVLNFGKSQNQMYSKWDMNTIVSDSIQLVRFKLRRNRVRVYFDPTDPVIVNCHKGQLQQVLLNLFINAEEAMPGGGEIFIKLDVDEQEKRLNVFFGDTGQGISDEIKSGIFDSFLSGKPTGSGLGLSIVKRILKEHRGNIEIESTGESGTTFRFWLPMADL